MIQVRTTSSMVVMRIGGDLISSRWAYVMPVLIPNIGNYVGDVPTTVTVFTPDEILINGNPIPKSEKNAEYAMYTLYLDIVTGLKYLVNKTGMESEWEAYEVIGISIGL